MLAFLTGFFWLRSKSFYEGITPSKINQVHVSNGIFVDIQISWRLLNCSAWLRSIPFNSFTKLCGLRVSPMTIFLCQFKMLCVFLGAWHVLNIALHGFALRHTTFQSFRRHATAWSQMKPSGMHSAGGLNPREARQ